MVGYGSFLHKELEKCIFKVSLILQFLYFPVMIFVKTFIPIKNVILKIFNTTVITI